ncbi:SDR family oxidoreductase [Stackebrandtia soli]|uniref:SDR family oxidoreductase n=1 Tax=Stackebrandtia soli TaxID=1892856 RepID=UPI0039ECF534
MVTGAASGIGAAATAMLRSRGHRVVACDRDTRITDDPDGVVLDVTDAGAVERAVADAERRVGPIGVLVNAAGILRAGPLNQTSDADFAAMFAVNTTGVFAVTRSVTTRMRQRRAGSVVTVASNAGGVPRHGIGGYAASKAASAHLTKCFGLELAEHGIRCNVVSPGSTDTPMFRSLWPGDGDAAVADAVTGQPERFRLGIPLGRVADPDDIARVVCFLASAEAAHLTMQELFVDGGASLR